MSDFDGLSRSLEFLRLWESLPVVSGLSWSLTVFQNLHLNCYFWRQILHTASCWRSLGSLAVARGVPYNTNETTGSLAVFQGRSRSLRYTSSLSQRPSRCRSLRVVTCFCKNFIYVSKTSFTVFDEISNTAKDH